MPTPLNEYREPDLSYIEATGRTIRRHLRPGQLVVLESTTYPGTTQSLLRPILEESGLQAGVDFFLAFAPEREDPGNPQFGTRNIPKVIGGIDTVSRDLTAALYEKVMAEVVTVSSTGVAEACKILENTYRAVNIALVNELKMLFDAMGIDIWEVIEAAKTKPFGFQPFYPGPGLGGHCIPIDPFYLTWVARKYGMATRFIELAGEINTAMPKYVVQRVADVRSTRKAVPSRGARSPSSASPTRRTSMIRGSRRRSRSWNSCKNAARKSPTTIRTSPRCLTCGTTRSGWIARRSPPNFSKPRTA